MYPDHDFAAIDDILLQSKNAFQQFKKYPLGKRAQLLQQIAIELQAVALSLIPTAKKETNLSEERLRAELDRTIFQLNQYADAILNGNILEARIDTSNSNTTPKQPDLRKMMVPLGPVLVFGASNFPFAYSTAGGDTACALAAGCSVVVKAHPAHAETSSMVAKAIQQALAKCELPKELFAHVFGADFKVGEYLVGHPVIQAVGFTGSLSGGRSLFDVAVKRECPIPVFAEMGSTNPVFLLNRKLQSGSEDFAKRLMKSITQDMGQFCTKPGLVIGLKGEPFDAFTKQLNAEIHQAIPGLMLHKGIASNYLIKMQTAIMQRHVEVLYQSANVIQEAAGMITLAKMPARYFLTNKIMHEEVFGPYSLLVECNNMDEMLKVAEKLSGQLTCTLLADNDEIEENDALLSVLTEKCGRFILNAVPTGVSVALAMQHGGPYPATTDSRFTSVGADGIKRFMRPICFQNWDDELLPISLQNANPLQIWRTVNNELSRENI